MAVTRNKIWPVMHNDGAGFSARPSEKDSVNICKKAVLSPVLSEIQFYFESSIFIVKIDNFLFSISKILSDVISFCYFENTLKNYHTYF